MLSIFNLSGGTAQSGRSHCSIQAEPLLNFAGRADFAERRTHPDGNSALMLVCARLRHVAGTQWGSKKYMNMKHLEVALDDAFIAG